MNSNATMRKLGLLGALYLSQGLPYGFFTQSLPVMMRQTGRSLEEIGLASLLAIPWALKFLWAPWVDRHGWRGFGLRKSWIVPLQLLTALVLACAAWLDPRDQFSSLLGVVLVVNALSATQDIATDGLAVDMLSHEERGLANGLQVGAYRLGMVLGGGVLLILFSQLGWKASFLAMSATIVVATVPTWLHQERTAAVSPEAARAPRPMHFLRLRGTWPLLTMLFVFKFGDAMATTMLRPFMADHGLGLEDVGWLLGTVGFVAGLLGALAGGWLAGAIRRRTALLLSAGVQAFALAAYALVALQWPGSFAFAWVVAAEHAAGGMATAALFTCMMDWCRPGSGGSDYTAQASTVVIASGVAAAFSGFSAHHLGYAGHFTVAFGLGLVSLLAVLGLFPSSAPTAPRVNGAVRCA